MAKRVISVPMVFSRFTFANAISTARLGVGMSADEVASLVGVDKSTIAKYERGIEPNMKIQNFLALCNLFDLNPHDYIELEQ